jgi:hypothetical protein
VGKWETRSVFQGGFIAAFSIAAYGGEFSRGSISQRRMRPMMVVVIYPKCQLAAGVNLDEEHFQSQTLVANPVRPQSNISGWTVAA